MLKKHVCNGYESIKEALPMATDREMRKFQEEVLFENFLAQEVLIAKKHEQYMKYLQITSERAKSGMTAEEIEAVYKRAVASATTL